MNPFISIKNPNTNKFEDLYLDCEKIANLTGAPQQVISENTYALFEVFHAPDKYAFFYCGVICEVRVYTGSNILQVYAHADTEQRSREVEQYIANNIVNSLSFQRKYECEIKTNSLLNRLEVVVNIPEEVSEK